MEARMKEFTETFMNLCHGTDSESAQKICRLGFIPSKSENNWCGSGVYFYDIKAKAWWSANRTCNMIKQKDGKKVEPAVLFVDIVDLPRKQICDLRSAGDLIKFKSFVDILTANHKFQIEELDETERIIKLRSYLIDYYANVNQFKLFIGTFEQRPREDRTSLIEFASGLSMVFSLETIYCVKDNSIIKNIRQGGMNREEDVC